MKKKYKVTATYRIDEDYLPVIIEAENENEAEEICVQLLYEGELEHDYSIDDSEHIFDVEEV